MTEVNQVTVVRQDLGGSIMILLAGRFKIINDFGGQRRGTPLALIFGEQGECGRFDFCGSNSGVSQTASGAYVRSDIFHKFNPPYSNTKRESIAG